MRILHVLNTLGFGGAENHVASLACAQRDAGHSVRLVGLKRTASDPDTYSTTLERAGVSVTSLDIVAPIPIGAVRPLRQVVSAFEPSVVHSHLLRADLAVALASSRFSREVTRVATVHGYRPQWLRPAPASLMRRMYRKFDTVIVISEQLRTVLSHIGLVPDQLTRIPYGIDPGGWNLCERIEARRHLEIPNSVPVIGSLARLAPQKSLDVLIDAIAMLPNVHGVVIGADEGAGASLHNRVSRWGIEERFHLVGFRPDARYLLRAFDIFCLPSKWEGLGLVLLEAGAAGVPIVASAIAPIDECVVSGESGILVPPGDAAALAGAIHDLLDHPAYARALACRMRDRVFTEFSVSAMADRTFAVYRLAIEARGMS